MASYNRYTAGPARPTRGPLWLRVLKWFVLVLVVCVALTAGVMTSFLQRTAATVAHNDPKVVQAAKPQLSVALPDSPVNILILGTDGAPNRQGSRSDTLMVVRLDPQSGAISMLSVPRDLLVAIPGYGPTNKINAAFSYGGVKLSLEVTKQVLGIPINDFVVINFNGFTDIVNKLGGAYLMVDTRYYNNTATDDWASINIEPGYQRLDGAQTLSFVRFRHDQNGDFTRIARQQMFLREMKREVMSSARLSSLPRFLSVMTILSHNVVSDISSLAKLYSLLTLVLQINTTHIYQTEIDGSTPTINGIDYVSATPQQIQTAVQQFLHPVAAPSQPAAKKAAPKPTTPQLPAAKVSVTVLNGSGQPGVAASATSQLEARGYQAHLGGNAASFSYTTTTIAADPASQTVARHLAALLAPARLQPGTGSGAIAVTLGSSFGGHLASASSGSTRPAGLTVDATPYDPSEWRALQHETSLPLYAPSSWSASLGYDQFRAYSVRTPSGLAKAAVVVGTTPQGGYWDVQALAWTNPPILLSPDVIRTIAGRSYSFYYDGARLHMVAWQVGHVAYWVSNTLDDELSNSQMLDLATSCVPVR
jgi:LCP family protein required for cell wall assembly